MELPTKAWKRCLQSSVQYAALKSFKTVIPVEAKVLDLLKWQTRMELAMLSVAYTRKKLMVVD